MLNNLNQSSLTAGRGLRNQLVSVGHLSFSAKRRLKDAALLPEYQLLALACYLNNRGKQTPPRTALEECQMNCWRVYLAGYSGVTALRPTTKVVLRIIRETYLADPSNGKTVTKSNRLRSAVRRMFILGEIEKIVSDSIQLAQIVRTVVPDLPWLVRDYISKPPWIKYKEGTELTETRGLSKSDIEEEQSEINEEAISRVEIEVREFVDDDIIQESLEGRVMYVLHKRRERNRELVIAKKKAFLKEFGRLYCEICQFDFARTYGAIGDGFIECHHITPISTYNKEETTRIEDLKLLCANCHRMIHKLPLGDLLTLLNKKD
jgi:hypothetical protein